MNAAIIVMTILGCDDTGVDCHYIATAEQKWPTIELCDSVAEKHLVTYANAPYPVIIAVCQKPEDTEIATALPETAKTPEEPVKVTPQGESSLAARAIQRVRNVLPTTEGVRTLMHKPVRLIEGSYSWVARKFER
ncbi:hypothetical protein [Rhizobium sp. LCM 4573]|uniref:hypothetical protein n=1 Tax=Rhizobium sp. LCM 4573 TaxID=1848291 RepID=UPI0008D96787|nr:hypothetical protein [Rhizobium sp. LCM 4573]OHV81468.1 hypothetical protein LCM4573_20440 [Rhizobium sp. LCM 4573]